MTRTQIKNKKENIKKDEERCQAGRKNIRNSDYYKKISND